MPRVRRMACTTWLLRLDHAACYSSHLKPAGVIIDSMYHPPCSSSTVLIRQCGKDMMFIRHSSGMCMIPRRRSDGSVFGPETNMASLLIAPPSKGSVLSPRHSSGSLFIHTRIINMLLSW